MELFFTAFLDTALLRARPLRRKKVAQGHPA
jgi:hypothetical protein